MPRDLPIGNGNLLINFDRDGTLVDLFYPFVGQENHLGRPCRFGVWTDGTFAWLSAPEWQRDLRYEDQTLVTQVTALHPGLALRLTCTDAVDIGRDLYLKRVTVENLTSRGREVRLFFHVDPELWGHSAGDTVYFDPAHRAVVCYKGQRYLWLSARHNGAGLSSYTTGQKEVQGEEGSWRDAEDGVLSRNPIAQGSVDAVGSCHVTVPAQGSSTVYFTLGVGQSYADVRLLDRLVTERGPESFIKRTREYWRLWVGRNSGDFADLPAGVERLYRLSLLILRTHVDNRGAIIAASDSDVLQFGRDSYIYVWPRDGALVAYALALAGYGEPSRRFFDFCADAMLRDGYLLHKYNPDGSPGPSWHPWSTPDDGLQLPIQEDETALVLWSLGAHYERFRDLEFIKPLYRRLIKSAADFLVRYREGNTGLPAPSYDLWEERRGIFAFTAAAVWAGLQAAANFTEAFGETEPAASYRQAAQEMRAAVQTHLYDPASGRFCRGISVSRHGESPSETGGPDGTMQQDRTLDASLAGLFLFGMLDPDDPALVRTMQAIEERLWCRTPVGGLARYEHDTDHQVSQDVANVPGNPWIICTLWLADWHIARARSLAELNRARTLLAWVMDRALPSGVLAEQVDPYTGTPLSVSPLTWSHAALVISVRRYVAKYQALRLEQVPEQEP